jgi:hypothetical protein
VGTRPKQRRRSPFSATFPRIGSYVLYWWFEKRILGDLSAPPCLAAIVLISSFSGM